MSYGNVLINGEHLGRIVAIKNPKPNGKRIEPVYFPIEDSQEAEFPELTWERVEIECYGLNKETEITDLKITNLDNYPETVSYCEDLTFLKSFMDTGSNCLVIQGV